MSMVCKTIMKPFKKQLIDLSKEEIISNIFIDNQDNPFDESYMPLKDSIFEFGSVFKPFTVYSAIKNNMVLFIDEQKYF